MSPYDDPESVETLKAEIARLRRALEERQKRKFGIAAFKRVLIIALIAGSIVVALWLVLAQKARDTLVRQWVRDDLVAQASTITLRDASQAKATASLAEAKESANGGARTTDLRPSPPPTSTVRIESTRRASPASGAETPDRRARRNRAEAEGQDVAEQQSKPAQPEPKLVRPPGGESEPPQSPARAPQVSQATGSAVYNLVLSSRPKMKLLVSQGQSRWSIVKEDNGVVWIDIVVARDGEEHYIWAVDLQKKTVEALSQAARNLEG